MRNKTLDLLYACDAKVKIVYLEAPEPEIKEIHAEIQLYQIVK